MQADKENLKRAIQIGNVMCSMLAEERAANLSGTPFTIETQWAEFKQSLIEPACHYYIDPTNETLNRDGIRTLADNDLFTGKVVRIHYHAFQAECNDVCETFHPTEEKEL